MFDSGIKAMVFFGYFGAATVLFILVIWAILHVLGAKPYGEV